MRRTACHLILLATGVSTVLCGGLHAEDSAMPTEGVVEIRFLPEGALMVGTNQIDVESLPQILSTCGDISAVALINPGPGERLQEREAGVIRTVLKRGLPLFMIESDGAFVSRPKADQREPTRIGLSDVQLRHLVGLHRQFAGAQAVLSNLPAVSTTFEVDSDQSTYLMRKVELGIYGRQLWLIHEQTDNEQSTSGIQLKKTW